MKYYELYDDLNGGKAAVEQLNILSKSHNTKIVGYQVVSNQASGDYTCILVEVSE
jgi:hypothetical protein